MRVTPLYLLALPAAFAATKNDETRCSIKNFELARTIGGFCRKMDMVVPSDYTSKGKAILDKGIVVMIGGNCSPPQWVPRKYCLAQFYRLCAEGSLTGSAQGKFGKDQCQHWVINTAPAIAGGIL